MVTDATTEVGGIVFIVDGDAAFREAAGKGLTHRKFSVTTFGHPSHALAALRDACPEVLITDARLPTMSGIEFCERSRDVLPELPVIVLASFTDAESTSAIIRAGAYDLLSKPVDIELIAAAADRAVRFTRLTRELRMLRTGGGPQAMAGLVGTSPAMARIYDLVARLADSNVTVLVTGESGTGKELVASALHDRGPRRDGPFRAVNCAALPEPLLESELFGHVRGAFTDARQSRTGLLVAATGGTLFLDEIGDMPLSMQAKLLRALQERRVRPIGAEREIPFDARVVAATNRDLSSLVEAKRFREDLYFRLNVVEINLPPLRSRGNDVLALAQHFLAQAAQATKHPHRKLSRPAASKLLAYRWPGNVRELQNCMERAVALAHFDEVTVDDLPDRVRGYEPDRDVVISAGDASELPPLEEVERRYILRVLDAVGGQRKSAAKILGVDRKTLYRKLERYREHGYTVSVDPAAPVSKG